MTSNFTINQMCCDDFPFLGTLLVNSILKNIDFGSMFEPLSDTATFCY